MVEGKGSRVQAEARRCAYADAMDLQLARDEDGMEVIAAARRLQPEALPVLVSGATGPEALRRLRQGGVMLLTKPVAPAKLRALLATRRSAVPA